MVHAQVLAVLDAERRALGMSAAEGAVVRERSADGRWCRIVHADYGAGTPQQLDAMIRTELAAAAEAGYALEWKLYGHDAPPALAERLLAAGFEAGDREEVLALPVDDAAVAAFDTTGVAIRRVRDERGLADYAEIARQIGRRDVEAERRELAMVLAGDPESVSIHIAYVDGEPASGGRLHLRPGGRIAELAGGRTTTTHRRSGLFTAVVGSRLQEAQRRGRGHAFVDALPTSAATLRKRGFQPVTTTRPSLQAPSTLDRGSINGRIWGMSEATRKYSITMPADIAEAARSRSGPSGLSAYVAAAVRRQIERDNLSDVIAVSEAEHGPISEEEIEAKRDALRQARERQGSQDSGGSHDSGAA